MDEWRLAGVEREGERLAVLHELAPEKDGGARISPLPVSEWGATVDGRPPVLHELAPEKDREARISPLKSQSGARQ